jgi:hypothetical protein
MEIAWTIFIWQRKYPIISLSHPGACVSETQILAVGRFGFADAVRQPLQKAVVVQDDLPIQRLPEVDFYHVLSQLCSLLQGLQSVLWYDLVRGAMVQKFNPSRSKHLLAVL